jgi:16S rRNA (guanine527-N7)-methyltransferase
MSAIQADFSAQLSRHGLLPNEEQLNQFEVYYRELVSWNEKMNLTAITEREQVYWKHFFDSITPAFYVSMDQINTVADIGSGAGFPGIPLKIMFPHLQVTIVDSLQKRIQFLQHLIESLKLQGVRCIHGRAEDAARKAEFRDRFDLATARAVAKLQVLNEFCLPFVRKDGWFIAMKGSDPKSELVEAEYSLQQLQGMVESIHHLQLPYDQSERHVIVIRKTGLTPKQYPRKAGIPAKQPLAAN